MSRPDGDARAINTGATHNRPVLALQDLQDALDYALLKRVLHGIVVFRGSFELKTPIPEGVFCHRYDEWIAAKQGVILDDAAVEAIVRSLETNAFRGWRASLWHTRSVRERFASDSVCPKCGGALRLLMQRWGPDPGSQFLGCFKYPRCKFRKNVSNARVT